jgi:flagellar hook-basal body complex protein FliE
MIPAVALVSPVVSALSSAASSLSAAGTPASPAAAGMDFSKMLSEAVDSIKGAESTAVAGIQGKATTQQVVDAVMNAQTTFQTALSLRDKAVSAYQELSRMAI